jgi:hypothetical protein
MTKRYEQSLTLSHRADIQRGVLAYVVASIFLYMYLRIVAEGVVLRLSYISLHDPSLVATERAVHMNCLRSVFLYICFFHSRSYHSSFDSLTSHVNWSNTERTTQQRLADKQAHRLIHPSRS